MIPARFSRYIGLPYLDKGRTRAGVDCWGLCRIVLREQAATELPDYGDAYTSSDEPLSVAGAIAGHIGEHWRQVPQPQPLDMLIIHIGGRPWHCGLIVSDTAFLHVLPGRPHGRQTFSCLARLNDPRWMARKKDYWRLACAEE